MCSRWETYYPETPYLHFRSFLKKHGLCYTTFHSLRHLSATTLINQGVHAKIISERLGHSNMGPAALRSAYKEAASKFDVI
nr:tyrosine-type recombinase/integrase [Brevibacillus sp. Leaf182]